MIYNDYMTLGRLWVVTLLLLAGFLFTYKLMSVPPGIETDEGAIAHNAALIAKTGRDQNGRFLPFFILSSDKIDWKQPVMIYMAVIYFKIFGTSLLVFKLINVTVGLLSLVLVWILLKNLFSQNMAIAGAVVLVTSPIVIVSARLGTEAIHPLLFGTLWILALVMFGRNGQVKYLMLAAMSLGLGFYSYKGMRLIVPPWTVLTGIYILWKRKNALKNIIVFLVFLAPFFLITPILEQKYPGAVFDRRGVSIESYRHYAYYWLSNLGLGFLFVQGDVGKIFPVELFGTFLLSALPFFLWGVKKACDKLSFFTFVLICYLATPMLFGAAGSMGYGHRLEALVPLYVIIVASGVQSLAKHKVVMLILISFFVVNFFDFAYYYFYKYSDLHQTREAFPNNLDGAFRGLAKKAKDSNLSPYVQEEVYYSHGEGIQFFEAAYFDNPLKLWKLGDSLPKNSVLLNQEMRLVDE